MFYSALIGHPVDHSLSPSMFTFIAKAMNMDYAHLKIDIKSDSDLPKFLQAIDTLGFVGMNITIPYKIEISKYVDELHYSAQQTRTVNTIKFTAERTIGYNTDGIAALRAIESQLLSIAEHTKVLLIGAGGAARAILYELYKKTQNITVMNQDSAEAISMIELGFSNIPVLSLSTENYITEISRADLIINATPVGMYHYEATRLYSSSLLDTIDSIKEKFFFDVVFNPFLTYFLLDAREHGAKVCSGLYMMIYQVIIAFSLWTDRSDVEETINIEEAKNYLLETAYRIFEE